MKHLKSWFMAIGIALAGVPSAWAADLPGDASESDLKAQWQSAAWPADIVRLSDRLLRIDPASPAAAGIQEVRERAVVSARLLSSNAVHLHRSAFAADGLPPERRQDLVRAGRGDAEAALRLARFYQHDADGLPSDRYRYLGWMQYAALLGNDKASYEVSVYYRREGEPSMAATYQTRAVALGYVVPTELDNIRK